MTKFAHLHQHTSYSLLDGLSGVKDLLKWVSKDATDPSCAITDHGNMSGVLQFYKYAIQFGVKPILGYEAYITAGSRHTKQKGEKTYHLTLLAKDFEGYQNLCRLNYLANSEGYYYKPRIDHEILEQHSKGVIAMSGCLGAELQQHILNGDIDSARSTIEWYLKVFKDNYYIEIQNHGLPEQQLVNPILMQLAKEYGVGMVATNDGHYVKKTDSDTHDTLLAIQTKARLSDDNRFKFPCDEFYTKSVGEMELFLPRSVWGDEIYDNTVNISQDCNVELPIGSKRSYRIPQPKLQEGDTSDAKIYRLVNKGLRKRYGSDLTADKIKRAEYELSVIKKMGFTDYFLIVQDYINWAKKQGIAVGLGRGSGAGSIIAYAIGITDVDPIKYGLIFERFLNPDRVSYPDFDVDYSDTGREKVIGYVREKYGEDHVCMIGTYGAMLSRSCLKDVARAMGISHDTVNILTGMIPVKFGKPSTLMEAYESSQQIRDFLDMHEDVKRAYYYALNLEGTIRSSGVHASGLIISDTPLTDLIPLTVDRATGKSVSQYDMHDVEDIGLVKMDFLGLRTLTFLEKARDLLLQHKGISVVFNDVPLDDPKVYKLLSRGDNKGIFQLEGSGISQASKSLKPERFEDIVALTSLYRPGPMDNIGTYIKRRHGLEEISYKDFPQSGHLLSSILEVTYGIPVYQEQIMHISTSVAGYTLAESDTLRKAMGKKSQSEMDKQRTKFIEGAKTANDIDPEEAERLFELLNKFANYGFNRSHAVAYSMLSYQTAWLKVNHPDVFYAALLSVEYGDQDKVAEYIQDARRYGIKVLPPDINKSQREFAITDGVIYFGLSAIKSLGVGAIDAILEARGERQFEDLIDITQRIAKGNLNSRALGMLIKAGALDSLGDRSQQLASIESLRKPLSKRNPKPRQLVDDYTPYTSVELLKLERDAIGLYVSGNPLDSFPEFKAARSSTIAGINDWCSTQPAYYQNRVRGIIAGTISGITKIQTKRGQIMAKLLIEDETAVIEVIVFADDWQQMALNATMDSSALLYCDITPDDDNGSPRLVGKRLLTYDDLVLLPRIAVITLDMLQVDTNTLETLTEDFRGTTDDARGIVRIDTGYDTVSMDLGDLRVSKSIGDALDEIDGVDVVYTYEPKSLLQFVGGR